MIKTLIWCITVLFSLNSFALSQEKTDAPYWVIEFKPENTDDYYYGVGLSDSSSELADNDAYLKLAKMIKVSVKSEEKRTIIENILGIFDFWSQSSSVKTDEELSGIPISERYKDSAIYFSLIRIQKAKYVELKKQAIIADAALNEVKIKSDATLEKATLITEADLMKTKMETEATVQDTQERLKRKKEAAKQAKRAQKKLDKLRKSANNPPPETSSPAYSSQDRAIARRAELEAARDRAEAEELKRQNIARRAAYRQQKKANRASDHREFTNISPPRDLITFTNAQLIKKSHQVSLGVGIDPFTLENVSYSYHLWYTEVSLKLEAVDNQLEWQEAAIKLQVLPLIGGYYRTSIGIGAVEYLSQISETNSELWRPKYSPFLTGNIAIPHLLNSYFSFYGDYRKISLGLNSFLFFKGARDRFNLVTQVDIITDENYLNRFGEDVIFSAGLQFKTMDALNTTLSYEDHKIFVLRFGYEF